MIPYPSLRQGLVGAWCPLLGATGLTLIDRSGRGVNGTLTNMGGQNNWRANGSGVALNFDGTNDYVDLAPVFSGRSVVTVSFWGRPTSTTSRVELNEGTNSTTRAAYGLAEDGNAYILPGSTAAYGSCNWASLGVDRMIHAAFVFDATRATNVDRARIFLNGSQQTLTFIGTIPTTAPTFTGRLRIGLRPDDVTFSSGLIDDIRVYNRALTASEIRLLASRRGIGLTPLSPRLPPLTQLYPITTPPNRIWSNESGVWTPGSVRANESGSWRNGDAKVNDGGVWE